MDIAPRAYTSYTTVIDTDDKKFEASGGYTYEVSYTSTSIASPSLRCSRSMSCMDTGQWRKQSLLVVFQLVRGAFTRRRVARYLQAGVVTRSQQVDDNELFRARLLACTQPAWMDVLSDYSSTYYRFEGMAIDPFNWQLFAGCGANFGALLGWFYHCILSIEILLMRQGPGGNFAAVDTAAVQMNIVLVSGQRARPVVLISVSAAVAWRESSRFYNASTYFEP
ncbi:hypothetical protein EDD85DRAFT_943230 [Armillaria nabsnona]|nr:hypothetical protein EDD85DRAFT_943230 [Armillaria nabsnona]